MLKSRARQIAVGLALLLSLLGGIALGPAPALAHTNAVRTAIVLHPDCPGLPCG